MLLFTRFLIFLMEICLLMNLFFDGDIFLEDLFFDVFFDGDVFLDDLFFDGDVF